MESSRNTEHKNETVCQNSSRLNTHAVSAQLLAKGKEGTQNHQKFPESHWTLVFLSRSIHFRLKSTASLLEGESRNPSAGWNGCMQRKQDIGVAVAVSDKSKKSILHFGV